MQCPCFAARNAAILFTAHAKQMLSYPFKLRAIERTQLDYSQLLSLWDARRCTCRLTMLVTDSLYFRCSMSSLVCGCEPQMRFLATS